MAANGAPALGTQALEPEYVIGYPTLTSPTDSPLEQFRSIVSSIAEHSYSPHHRLRWNSTTVLTHMREAIAIFYAQLTCIASSLELQLWKTALIDTTQIVDKYVNVTLGEEGGFIHLDCPIIMEIAEQVHDALAACSRQLVRFNQKIGGVEVPLGWGIGNKYARTLTPDGFPGHSGFANCIFLHLLWICNRCIGTMNQVDIADGNIPVFSPNLAFLIVDKTVECYCSLKSIFTRCIAVTSYNCRNYAPVDGLVDWFCCIALPASQIESLNAGLTTLITTPLGQLNAQLTVDAALRKMCHWFRQGRFNETQQRELVKIIVFRPLRRMTDVRLKVPDGTGGFALYHNCSFMSSSWCLTIDSRHDPIANTYSYILDGLVRQHSIVLELPTLTVESLASMMHNSCYANWVPTETVHRHCTLPLTHLEIEGSPELYLLSENDSEIAADDIASSASAGIDPSTGPVPDSLTREEYSIMLSTAAAIAKKRKGENAESTDWSEYQGALFDDPSWTEDDWYGDWWYDDSHDWSQEWSWYDDSSWQTADWPQQAQLALPPPAQPIAKAKAIPKLAPKRENAKNTDYWVINEEKNVLVRFHVKPRQYLMAFRYLRGKLPVDESRLTGHRETERFFKDGSADVIVDQDFRTLDDDKVDNRVQPDPENIVSWRGRTTFKLKPLTGKALEEAKKVALQYQGIVIQPARPPRVFVHWCLQPRNRNTD
ncbi:unnamed protein product [Symbiodinium sp. CCMP2592]|nr:unnamed protein product [Symbiodinium sp. CCMP2592]